MMRIKHTRIETIQGSVTLYVYIEDFSYEFAKELGRKGDASTPLDEEIRKIAQKKYPGLKINTVKIILGTMMIGAYPFHKAVVHAATTTTTTTQTMPYSKYQVQSGDTLYRIATRFNTSVDRVKALNNLKTDNLYVGQQLTVPVYSHIVVKGDTLASIAQSYHSTVDGIKIVNNLTSNTIYVGQKLFIPADQPSQTTTAPPAPTTKTYQVAAGDTLFQIAKKFGITVDDLKKANGLKTDTLSIGQILIIPADQSAPSAPAPAPTPPPVVTEPPPTTTQPETKRYTVAAGDTLFLIAKRFGTTVDDLKKANGLTSDMLSIGQILIIPTGQPAPVPAPPPTVDQTYTVAAGDTLYLIANKYDTTVAAIKEANHLTSDFLSVGQKLTIPAPAAIAQPPKETAPPQEATYTVAAGDTLFLIAKKFNTTVAAIKDRNHLNTDMLLIGQVLTIPATSDTAAPAPPADTTAPVIEDVNSAEKISAATAASYVITGKSEAGSKVLIQITDTAKQTVQKTMTAGANGTFSETFNLTSLKDGQVTIRINATDQAGNKSADFTKTAVKKTLAPAVPVATQAPTINSENAAAVTIKGTAEIGSVVHLVLTDAAGNKTASETRADQNGTFTAAINATRLGEGTLTLTGYAVDGFGNRSDSFSKNILKDTLAPTVLNLAEISAITLENQKAFIIQGQTEANGTVDFAISDGSKTYTSTAKADDTGAFSITLDASKWADGKISVKAHASDANGNKGLPIEQSVIKDTTAPTGLAISPAAERINNKNQTEYHVRGTSDEDGAIVEITATDGKKTVTKTALVVNKAFDMPLNLHELADGTITFTFKQRDNFGNTSTAITQTQIKDTISENPVINRSTITNNGGVFTYQMQGTAEPNSDILVSISGASGRNVTTQTVHTMADGTFTLTANISAYIEAHPFITTKQIDAAGNESTTTPIPINRYTVGSGDTLWKIATRFGTSVDEITKLNQLTSTMIWVGQELKLPLVAGLETEVMPETEAFNMGYLYFGSSTDFINTMNQTAGTINVVSPTYFDLNSDGTLKLTAQTDRYFIAGMQKSNVRVVPFVSNHWNRDVGNAALDNREKLAQQIADEVALYNLDGVNVDIENVTEAYRDKYVDFVRLLREKLPAGKEVSVAVAANPTGSTTGWHGSYDYNQLAKYSDYLMIMAYDESYPGGPPGPVASIGFVERSIQYALDQGVPKDKIVLGIGHYGRYWKEGSSYGGEGISNQQVNDLVKQYNGTITFDKASQTPKATFTIKATDPKPAVYGKELTAGNYVVWFENEQSLKAKYDLVAKYGIKGTGNWGVEQENPDFWETFSSWVSPSQNVATAPETP